MSFLQPWMLWGLPFIALPIAIHLIHRRRQRVVEWGAMMFLLQGAKMSKGMQRLRQLLLLALRTIAVVGLIIGLGRPIAGGWLGGFGGGRPDVVLVLLDRSASMTEEVAGGRTKLATGVERLAAALESVHATRLVVIDSVGLAVTELAAPSDLIGLPIAGETATRSDVPAMFEVAAEHLRANSSGRAEIWICSDGQASDWNPEDGRWPALQDKLIALPAGVRVNVLGFPQRAAGNLAVRLTRAERVRGDERTELSLDLQVRQTGGPDEDQVVPVVIDLAGARSVVQVELSGGEAELKGHRLAIDDADQEGWGFVELPIDANAADNRFYFTYGGSPVQETVIVCEDAGVASVLRMAAEAPLSDSIVYAARVVPPGDTASLDLTGASLLLWQAPLPEDEVALVVEQFLVAGGQVLCLPPDEPRGATFLGCSWGPAREVGSVDAPAAPTSWRREGDLLRNGDDGTALPLKALELRRVHSILGDVTPLAGLEDGEALLARAPTERGGLYFFGTTTATAASNLANQGVILVALVHRSLAAAAEEIGSRGQQEAGTFEPLAGGYELVSESQEHWLLSEHLDQSGVVRVGKSFVALNRAGLEDLALALADETLAELMPDVEMSLVRGGDDSAGLVEEIWRIFLILLLVALIGEALLCVTESTPREVKS